MFGATPEEKAYTAPFLALLALMLLGVGIASSYEGLLVPWYLSETRYWVNPAQTLICGFLIVKNWRYYPLAAPKKPFFALGVGTLVLALWIAPQEWLGFALRHSGFNPYVFGLSGPIPWLNITLRLLKIAVVVPFVEEIFWRGFLLRFVINTDFTRVPFGQFRWDSFIVVTLGFTVEHYFADWPAAVLAGVLYNLVAYRTRSLFSCILAHAATNLLLGLYILRTGQWGFW